MKKTIRRLSLSKETIRDLASRDLGRLGGAQDPDSDGLTCFCSETCTACPTHYFSGCAGCAFTDGC